VFLWVLSGFYLPGQGFTSTLLIGDKWADRAIPQLLGQKPYVEPESDGYDGQFYVQIAMQPDLHDPALQRAVDNLPYRARRILLSWTAWLLGGGEPGRTMHIFSVLNIFSWLALAGLLLRWFPATSWNNYLRWAGVLLSFGLCFSVRASLLDGPSLLVIAIGLALLESGRPWWACLALGSAGLIRETNILAASALFSFERKSSAAWTITLVRCALVILPCLLWVLYLFHVFGAHTSSGEGNFDLPFHAFLLKWQSTLGEMYHRGFGGPNDRSLLLLIALTTQAAVLLLRPRISSPWWRLGVVYLVLMIILGPAVWEGYPGAAARTLLPMGLAFNVLVPSGRRWLAILLLGNATIFCSLQSFQYPGGKSVTFAGASELHQAPGHDSDWSVNFSNDWFPPKRSHWEYWRWSRGDAHVSITNPLNQPVVANVRFELKSRDVRIITVQRGQERLWCGTVTSHLQTVQLDAVLLAPGDEVWSFKTEDAGKHPASSGRAEVFCLRNLKIELLHLSEPKPSTGANIPAPAAPK